MSRIINERLIINVGASGRTPVLIEEIPLPVTTFSSGNYSEYRYALDDSGNIHYIELYRTPRNYIKTRLYYGSFNNLENKEELGQFNFISVADIEADANGDVWIAYQNRITQVKGEVQEVIQLKKQEPEDSEIPELTIKVYYDVNCSSPIDISAYYPVKVQEKLYLRIESVGELTSDARIHVTLMNNKMEQGNSGCFLYSDLTVEKELLIKSGSKISNTEEIMYYNHMKGNTIGNIVIDKFNDIELGNEKVVLELPEDSDNDQMPDAWEREEIAKIPAINQISNFNPDWDGEDINGYTITQYGDGFSAYLEYIGFRTDQYKKNYDTEPEIDENKIRRMSNSKIDLFFIPVSSQVNRFDNNKLLTNETKKVLINLDIDIHLIRETDKFIVFNETKERYLLIIDYKQYKNANKNDNGIIEFNKTDIGFTEGEFIGKMGTGNGRINIYEGTLKNYLDLPPGYSSPENLPDPKFVDYKIRNWVHESVPYYQDLITGEIDNNPWIRVPLYEYRKDLNSKKESKYKIITFDGTNKDGISGLNWLNAFDAADDKVEDRNDFKCFHKTTEDFITRTLLHEIGHSMNMGEFDSNGKEIAQVIILSYKSPSCMWYGTVDPDNHSIVNSYSQRNFNRFSLRLR